MVEAMVALVLVDQLMAHYAQCYLFPINPELQDSLSLSSAQRGIEFAPSEEVANQF